MVLVRIRLRFSNRVYAGVILLSTVLGSGGGGRWNTKISEDKSRKPAEAKLMYIL